MTETTRTRRLDWPFWGFVAFGCALRLLVYGLQFPLWQDETALAANFIDRGFADFPRTLDFGQVAPLLFAWGEVAAVQAFGYHEWSLRLLPLLGGVASIVLFAVLARRTLNRNAALFAVAMLAVSYYPIRHSAEVKPYATDLCVATVLLLLAQPLLAATSIVDRQRAFRSIAFVAPFALGLSFPAVFVLGGILLVAAPPFWEREHRRDRGLWIGYAFAGLVTAASFLVYLKLTMGGQYRDHRTAMVEHWGDAFPPLGNPLAFAEWLLQAATGVIFAYPFGGKNGCSAATAAFFAIGVWSLHRSGRRSWSWLIAAVFGLAFVAAALERYPLGGHARVVQYLAPLILLPVGAGAETGFAWARRLHWGAYFRPTALVLLLFCGVGIGARALAKPYSRPEDRNARQFARWLWREKLIASDAVYVNHYLAKTSPGVVGLDFHQSNCYRQLFQSSSVHAPADFSPPVSENTAYVVFVWNPDADRDRCVANWLQTVGANADVKKTESHRINAGGGIYDGEYRLYWFTPKRVARTAHDAAAR